MELEADTMLAGIDPKQMWEDFADGILKPLAALAVVGVAVLVAWYQELGIERDMLYSIARAFVQLSIAGFFLEFIFKQKNAALIFLAYMLMVAVAGHTAGQRAKYVPHAKYVAGASILFGTALTMSLLICLDVFPFTPRYIIPVAGMMVGSSMSVTGVTLNRLRDDIKLQQNLIETALSLGATPRQATAKQVRRALVLGLAPVLDSAKTLGLVTLPGAMTGLIMGGSSPMEAIQLQLVVMNMQVGASTMSAVLATYLSWPSFFTAAYQLESQLLLQEG